MLVEQSSRFVRRDEGEGETVLVIEPFEVVRCNQVERMVALVVVVDVLTDVRKAASAF